MIRGAVGEVFKVWMSLESLKAYVFSSIVREAECSFYKVSRDLLPTIIHLVIS